jgi:hypothetical protein
LISRIDKEPALRDLEKIKDYGGLNVFIDRSHFMKKEFSISKV